MHCADEFAEVREEFERNFAERGEAGASVCVTVDGETVVDLWGGEGWDRDTITVVWSCTKGAVALCAHMLKERGLLDFDAPVAQYWPEFAKNGKSAVTVRMALNHQAGVAALPSVVPEFALCDWDFVVKELAEMEPLWAPGTTHGYHALVWGHLIGEIVRRVDGRSVGTFFREEVAEPLGLDFWIGLPESEEPRVAPTIAADPPLSLESLPSFYTAAMTDPSSVAFKVVMHSGGILAPDAINNRTCHAAEMPAFGGIANARSLAGMYRPLANGGGGLVPASAIAEMARVTSAVARDATLYVPTRWSNGFMKANDNRWLPPGENDSVLLSDDAFGHLGAGGSLGFADPGARLSFGYAMTKQGGGTGLEDRGQALVDAVYRALGYTQPDGGTWWRG